MITNPTVKIEKGTPDRSAEHELWRSFASSPARQTRNRSSPKQHSR
jgi:hypothetical protein